MPDDLVAVVGTRRTMKELVDGTIRVQIDIDPPHRAAFLKHFPEIDMAVVIAPMTPQAAVREMQPEVPKGGPLAQLAGRWCEDIGFRVWLADNFGNAIADADAAAEAVREICGVKSRAEIDHKFDAREMFEDVIRIPYSQHLKELAGEHA
jgi:hypothetical protein